MIFGLSTLSFYLIGIIIFFVIIISIFIKSGKVTFEDLFWSACISTTSWIGMMLIVLMFFIGLIDYIIDSKGHKVIWERKDK